MALTVADLSSKLMAASELYSSSPLWIFAQSEEWKAFQGGCEDLMAFLEFSGHALTASRIFQGLNDIMKAIHDEDRDTWVEECFVVQQKMSVLLRRLGAIGRSWSLLRPEPNIPAPATLKDTAKQTDPVPKRSWTTQQLEEAIREYRAQRASTIQGFLSVLDNPSASRHKKQVAQKNASKLFGRNAIARALGVKSPRMVGQTVAWKALASLLQLPKKDNGVLRLGIAVSNNDSTASNVARSAANAYGGDDNSPPADVILMQKEQKETLRYINRLATSKHEDAAKQAEALLSAYQAGKMTDQQVRQTVDITLSDKS